MAGIRQGIIKRNEVQAEHARSADDTLLGRALRIPKQHVKVSDQPDEATALWQSAPLLRRGMTETASRPVEVRTRLDAPLPRRASEPVEKEEAPAEPTREEIEAEWKARLEAAREAAYAEGREAGQAEAAEQFDAQLAELRREFAENLDAIQHSWEAYLRRSEPQLVQLAFRVARSVLDAPLPDEVRQISERTVADAVERMAADVAVEIILHPVSFLRIQETGVQEQLDAIHSKLRWRTNADLKQNEWIVQSPRAATRRIETELIDQMQSELALGSADRDDTTPRD